MRGKMIRVGLLPKLIKFLTNGEIKNKSTILGLLYHASMDDKVKAMFPNTDCVPMVQYNLCLIYKFYLNYENN